MTMKRKSKLNAATAMLEFALVAYLLNLSSFVRPTMMLIAVKALSQSYLRTTVSFRLAQQTLSIQIDTSTEVCPLLCPLQLTVEMASLLQTAGRYLLLVTMMERGELYRWTR